MPFPKIGLFLTPIFCLLHLSSAVLPIPPQLEQITTLAWVATSLAFAAAKWDQPLTDDLGDKSIFDFLALPEDKQRERMIALGMTDDL